MSYPDNEPALKALEGLDIRAQALQEAAIDARSKIRALIEQRDELRKIVEELRDDGDMHEAVLARIRATLDRIFGVKP